MELQRGEAADIERFAGQTFDLILANSVSQYFPGADYLLDLIRTALGCLRPRGRLIIGDVRDLSLLWEIHTAIVTAVASREASAASLFAQVRQRVQDEAQRVVSPRWFALLPSVLSDASFDTVVTSLVMCSVRDPGRAELRRVVRRDGILLIIEHVRTEKGGMRAMAQNAIVPLWKLFVGGCHCNRPSLHTLACAGFRITELRRFNPPGVPSVTFRLRPLSEIRSKVPLLRVAGLPSRLSRSIASG